MPQFPHSVRARGHARGEPSRRPPRAPGVGGDGGAGAWAVPAHLRSSRARRGRPRRCAGRAGRGRRTWPRHRGAPSAPARARPARPRGTPRGPGAGGERSRAAAAAAAPRAPPASPSTTGPLPWRPSRAAAAPPGNAARRTKVPPHRRVLPSPGLSRPRLGAGPLGRCRGNGARAMLLRENVSLSCCSVRSGTLRWPGPRVCTEHRLCPWAKAVLALPVPLQ